MNEVNKTLFIPLYGKSQVSKKGIILNDPTAEKIWKAESFPIHGKSKSKWLAYNMAMRARVFDNWTEEMLRANKDALVLHIGCGLDSRCLRVKEPYLNWIDADFPEVLSLRKKYYEEKTNNKLYGKKPLGLLNNLLEDLDDDVELVKQVIDKSAHKGHKINAEFKPLSFENMVKNANAILNEEYQLIGSGYTDVYGDECPW